MRLHDFLVIVIGCLGAAVPTLASDPPDSAINPQSNNIEIADPVWTGSNQDIHYVVQPALGNSLNVAVVSDDSLDDRRPRLAIGPSGDAWVVWWRDDTVDRVVARKRTYADDSWSAERTLSLDDENSHTPHVVLDGTQAWVAYQIDGEVDRGIAVNSIIDEPDPIPTRSVIATTGHAGPIDIQIDAESGHLWVTWIDGAASVGWSEYDHASGTWAGPSFESFAADDVGAARERIRGAVVGN